MAAPTLAAVGPTLIGCNATVNSITVFFSEAANPSNAQELRNYSVFDPNPKSPFRNLTALDSSALRIDIKYHAERKAAVIVFEDGAPFEKGDWVTVSASGIRVAGSTAGTPPSSNGAIGARGDGDDQIDSTR